MSDIFQFKSFSNPTSSEESKSWVERVRWVKRRPRSFFFLFCFPVTWSFFCFCLNVVGEIEAPYKIWKQFFSSGHAFEPKCLETRAGWCSLLTELKLGCQTSASSGHLYSSTTNGACIIHATTTHLNKRKDPANFMIHQSANHQDFWQQWKL